MKSRHFLIIICLAIVAVGCAPRYEVGDLYDRDGKTGIVFCTTDGGRHGKILSLSQSEAPWQTGREIEAVGATDRDNGAINQGIVTQQKDWQQRFPAFAWCAEIGEGWYLPAIGELDRLGESWERVEPAVANAGGEPLDDCLYFWSSTETGDYTALLWRGAKTPSDKNSKIFSMYLRAVAAF